jgi:acyl-CoA thioesterase
MRVARICVDLLRPVPVAPLRCEAEIVREGRKIQLCAVRLLTGDTEVARASVLKLRREPHSHAIDQPEMVLALPLPDACPEVETSRVSTTPFVTGMSMRTAKGGFLQPGPAAIWFRADRPVVEGAPSSPAMRGVIAADFCNATAIPFSFTQWTFINADLTVHFAREPEGEWILLDATSWIGPDGVALAFGKLADARGYFGQAVQSILLDRR